MEYFLLKVEIKDYIVMIKGRNFFDQSVGNDTKNLTALEKLP